MELSTWISLGVGIVISILAWFINKLLIGRMDNIENTVSENKELLFRKLDENKKYSEENYVNQKLYNQAQEFHHKEIDSKFNHLIESMGKRFENVEDKIDDLKKIFIEKMK